MRRNSEAIRNGIRRENKQKGGLKILNNLLSVGVVEAGMYEVIALSVLNTVFMYFASFKFVQTLQQTGYDGRGYLSWLRRKDNIYMLRLIIVSILSILAFLIFNIAVMIFWESYFAVYCGFIFYVLFFIVYIGKDRKVKSKVPLVKTRRVVRLLVTFVFVTLLLTMLLLTLVNFAAVFLDEDSLVYKLRYGLLCLTPMLLPVFVLLAYLVNEPFERYSKRQYVEKCKAKLSARPDLIKIGITGSYGKTSVKEILSTILSEKYNVLATPLSYNTPMGICKTVKKLSPSHEVLIVEMGARNVGDIKELTDIVKPSIGIITGVTNQHIETFGSVTNIKKTKYELIEGLDNDGFAAFSADNEIAVEMGEKCPVSHVIAGISTENNPSVFAEDINVSGNGTRFTLVIDGRKIECGTVLIGTHNVSNICLAAAVAVKLGLSDGQIASGINRIKPIKHRLEVIEASNGKVVIDDSFNANVNGTVAAMEVLDCFSGRKIVVTPGLVELGSMEEYENYRLGERLGKHADIVILVGKRRVDKIKEGLISVDFPSDNIITVKDLSDGKKALAEIIRKGDVIIFENDLPDKYN